jgi:hypothetical protein
MLVPQLFKMGEGPRQVKRGAKGPSPARKMLRPDPKAARAGSGLVIRCARSGEVLTATKPAAAFAAAELFEGAVTLGTNEYVARRLERFNRWCVEVEGPRLEALGMKPSRILRELKRTKLKRFHLGEWEREVTKVLCPARN